MTRLIIFFDTIGIECSKSLPNFRPKPRQRKFKTCYVVYDLLPVIYNIISLTFANFTWYEFTFVQKTLEELLRLYAGLLLQRAWQMNQQNIGYPYSS